MLDHKKLHDSVYIKYNQQLVQRYNFKDENDPITLNDIDECSEWLVEGVDEQHQDARNEFVHEDDPTLNWETVYEASRVWDPRIYTRKKICKKKKGLSSVGIVIGAAQASKQGVATGKPSTSKGKGKEMVQVDEELEFDDNKGTK